MKPGALDKPICLQAAHTFRLVWASEADMLKSMAQRKQFAVLLLLALVGCRTPVSVLPTQGLLKDVPDPIDRHEWRVLLSGRSLEGWEAVQFGGEGDVEVRSGEAILHRGEPFTGMRWLGKLPAGGYEIRLEAVRWQGHDIFCGLTVPVGGAHCTLIVGGWGGGLVGISSLDGLDASENETASHHAFNNSQWYGVRLRVTTHRIEAWLDEAKVVDVSTVDRQVGLRSGMIGMSRPLGICSWATTAGIRNVRIRALPGFPGG